MGAQATFDFAVWSIRYPEFLPTVSEALASMYWDEACLYHRNDGTGPVRDVLQQRALLNMLTAHIAALNFGKPSDQPVGRVSNASEGSVTVAFANDYPPGSAQWYQQTRYGAAYYSATAAFRGMRYRVPCR